jgi:hypothetical protein
MRVPGFGGSLDAGGVGLQESLAIVAPQEEYI